MKVKNVPDSAFNHDFIVYYMVDGERHFHGAYDDIKEASIAMSECNGSVVLPKNIEKELSE